MTLGTEKYYHITNYDYDIRSNMTRTTLVTPEYVDGTVVNNTVVQDNEYNVAGQRIQKIEFERDENGVDGEKTITNYYYMGPAQLFSSNTNNWLLTKNILDPAGTIIASERYEDTNPGFDEGFYFYHYDMRGSTTAIVGGKR